MRQTTMRERIALALYRASLWLAFGGTFDHVVYREPDGTLVVRLRRRP